MRKKRKKIFLQILKNPVIGRMLAGYICFFALAALLILLAEPGITNYGSAAWYCFVSCTTIGFGDVVVTTFLSKAITVLLYLYSVVILAILTAVITQYFLEAAKAKRDESVSVFLHDLEHLPDLPPERLEEISKAVRTHRNA